MLSKHKRWLSNRYVFMAVVFILAFMLRILFVFSASNIKLLYDAQHYWNVTLRTRNAICLTTHLCEPVFNSPSYDSFSAGEGVTAAELTDYAIINRVGIMPLMMAPFLIVLPAQPQSIYLIFALLDGLTCVMLVHLMLKLKQPMWVAVLAGCVNALYIPTVIGSGAYLQQPFIRFWMVAVVWAYGLAITNPPEPEHRWLHLFAIAFATLGCLMIGYASSGASASGATLTPVLQ